MARPTTLRRPVDAVGPAAGALATLGRPLLAWIRDPEYNEFDLADFCSEHREQGENLSPLPWLAERPMRQS
ncbi:hypothetical protein OG196_43990 (plasmid) [Kitasatospora purpeofusca]|uniref:hypothetical protein n=1 Tax=Kitasatospora purpeofusca TaxID=67352 RepID=UPI002E0F2FB6|nr:hypothetical protein OG196_43990 [Kitasatospora purpeofusca]